MTIRKSTFLIAGLISLGMLACNSDNGLSSTMSQSSSSVAVAAPAVATPVSQVNTQSLGTVVHPPTKLGKLMNLSAPANFSASGSGLNPAHGMPGHDCAVAVGAPLPKGPVASSAPVASTASSNVKLNPAHGQPGHDCAVEVGAPLGSGTAAVPTAAPANALSGLTASKPTVASTPNFNANLKNINPAHGQPGHDCAVAVGAPLPAKGAAKAAAPASNISAPAATTPNFGLPANIGKVNPAHGQPGHDCAVAVGAPLPG